MSFFGVLPSVRIALETLRANPLRTLLSTLGIVMGAAALAAVLSLGDGAERFAREQIEDEGYQTVALAAKTADTIDGVRAPRYDYPVFSLQDAEDLAAAVPAAPRVMLAVQGTGLAGGPAKRGEPPGSDGANGDGCPGSRRGVLIVGLAGVRGEGTGLRLAHGRDLTAAEMSGSDAVAIVSSRLARELVGRAGDSALGGTFEMGGRSLRVAGILAGRRGERVLTAFVPLAAADTLMVPSPQPRARTLQAHAAGVEGMSGLKQAVGSWREKARPEWRDRVLLTATGEERLQQLAEGILLFKILMGSFTAISLLVGGIGIMNVLLASVAERTREIGIRKAIGASRRVIVAQFLAESVAISLAGSVVGVGVGLGGAAAVTAIMRARTEAIVYTAVTPGTIVVSMLAAAAVGLLFGTYPALRAARLSPVDAITRE
jgi:putative ABC transport system permease protein